MQIFDAYKLKIFIDEVAKTLETSENKYLKDLLVDVKKIKQELISAEDINKMKQIKEYSDEELFQIWASSCFPDNGDEWNSYDEALDFELLNLELQERNMGEKMDQKMAELGIAYHLEKLKELTQGTAFV